MIYLLLSILSSTLIFVAFKLFDRFRIHTIQAIVVNYFVACITGLLMYNGNTSLIQVPQTDWFYFTLALGTLFIIVFNLMAITTQRSGLSVVSVATKMSLVVPITFGIIYYHEDLGVFKFLGILLALVAVYLSSIKSRKGITIRRRNLIFPILVFLGSGFIDTSIKFLEDRYVAKDDVAIFSATIFAAAAIVGIGVLLFLGVQGKLKLQWKNITGGIVLGIPNFFSVYFLVKALRSGLLESSGIFTVNNVSIVMLSTLTGIWFFQEKLLLKNWIGVILAIISIFLVALSRF